jgi:STE24 endopeptidase
MHPFSLIFLFAFAAGIALQLWLSQRHIRHIRDHRTAVPESFADRIDLATHQRAADYTTAKTRLGQKDLLYGSLLLLLWTFGGGLQWLQGVVTALTDSVLLRDMLLVFAFALLGMLLDLPFSLWRTFVLEQKFGFNRTTPRRYLLDTLLQALLGLLLGAPLLWAFLWLMEQAGDLWWLYAWAMWIGFTLLLSWAYPVLIAPLFNRFQPLPEGEQRRLLEALLQRCGFTSNGLFVMDGSKRSSHGNAYFTGFGNNKRIVLYDTLTERLEPQELEAVLAHELGHFRLRHVPKRLVLMALSSLAGLALLGWLLQAPWFYQGLGVATPSHGMALLLFLMVTPVFSQFIAPLAGMLSRKHEFEADAYAVGNSDGHALIRALVKLFRDNASTLTPDPWYSAFHDSHPPATIRVQQITRRMAEA